MISPSRDYQKQKGQQLEAERADLTANADIELEVSIA
jgi:hypothetical protein